MERGADKGEKGAGGGEGALTGLRGSRRNSLSSGILGSAPPPPRLPAVRGRAPVPGMRSRAWPLGAAIAEAGRCAAREECSRASAGSGRECVGPPGGAETFLCGAGGVSASGKTTGKKRKHGGEAGPRARARAGGVAPGGRCRRGCRATPGPAVGAGGRGGVARWSRASRPCAPSGSCTHGTPAGRFRFRCFCKPLCKRRPPPQPAAPHASPPPGHPPGPPGGSSPPPRTETRRCFP